MKTRDADILIVPGYGGSGPDHWQTRWQAKLPTSRRVEQTDWDRPDQPSWSARLAEAIAEATRPVVIVAHSLGAVAVADVVAQTESGRVAGAFLVTPPAEDSIRAIPQIDPRFIPYSPAPLPCPSVLVASTDDPFCDMATAEALSQRWGATLLNAGAAGHINADSGHGPWPEGLMAFAGFLSKL